MEEKVKKKTTFWLPPDIIDFLSFQEPLHDGRHLAHHRLDDRKYIGFFRRILFKLLRLFQGDSIITGKYQCHMGSSCGFICREDHLSILQNTDSGGSAAYVHHSPVCDSKNSCCRCRLVHHIGHFKSRSLHNIGDATDIP